MPNSSPCRSCGAPVFFVKTGNGRLMPLDAAPVADGNIVLKDGMTVILSGTLFEETPPGPRYKSHYATCPQADKWRKK